MMKQEDNSFSVSRMTRLLRMISMLRSGSQFHPEKLAKELGVSRRTVFRDLNLLAAAGIPYRFAHEEGCYRLEDRKFLPPLHISLDEALALMVATHTLISAENHPLHEAAVEASLKIESSLPDHVAQHCGSALQYVDAIHEPASPADAVSDLFQRLQFALARNKRLIIRYDSVFEKKELRLVIDPARLVFITRGWYLIAMSHTHGKYRTFKIDRITDVEDTGDHYEPDNEFSLDKYFGKAWRMIPEGQIYDIRLRFMPFVATSVEEVQWHATQETMMQKDGSLLFHASVDGLQEIAPWVLSYGEHVQVLDPPELRERLVEKARGILAQAEAAEALTEARS